MSANYDRSPSKKKKKSSTSRKQSGHSQVKSASRLTSPSSPSTTSPLKDHNKKKRKRKDNKNTQQHSRYATAHTSSTGNKTNNPSRKKKKKKKKKINKIKSQNKKNAVHRKAATTANALHPNGKHTNNNHIKSSATSPNALSPQYTNNNGYNTRPKRTASNPRAFRHKFNMTEMHLVVSQIADMKKSWKTPAEDVMGKIYEIIYMSERPHLNGKHCKVMLVLDEDNYRVSLLGNSSEHVVAKENLNVAFETENLYLLWESMGKNKSKRSTYGQGFGDNSSGYNAPKPPPNQDPDDMYTIQQFEHTFNDTYEFRRYDFYCMCCCIFIGIIISGIGVFVYLNNDTDTDLHAMGAFIAIFGCMLCVLIGIYIGCIWYCCAVGKGKMDYYLGKNRFFGFECKLLTCCKYQYFIIVSIIGLIIIGISVGSYLLFEEFVAVDNIKNDTTNPDIPVNTNEKGDVVIDEEKLFIGVESIAAIGGIGLCIGGIIVYCCCKNRKVDQKKGPSIHDEEYGD